MRSGGNANLWAIVLSILGVVFGLIAIVFNLAVLAGLVGCGSVYVDEPDAGEDVSDAWTDDAGYPERQWGASFPNGALYGVARPCEGGATCKVRCVRAFTP